MSKTPRLPAVSCSALPVLSPGAALHVCLLLTLLQIFSVQARQPAPESRMLNAGDRVEQRIAPGQSHYYRVGIGAGDYFHTLIETSGGTLTGSLCAPGRRECVEFQTRGHGTTPLSLTADAGGEYTLELRSPAENEGIGVYVLSVEAVRAATAADETRVAAERACAEAALLRASWTAEGLRGAVEKYRSALALRQKVGDREGEVGVLVDTAEALHSLNELRQADKYYEAALALSKKSPGRRSRAEILNGLGSARLALGDSKNAFEYFREALGAARGARLRWEEARAVGNLGEAYYAAGDMHQALGYSSEALSSWRALNDREGQASALLNVGYAHSNLSNVRDATDAFEQSLRLWRVAKNPWGEAQTLTALGHLKSKVGEKQEALDMYLKARPLFQTMGDTVGEAVILNGMGYVYDELGRKETALEYHEEAHGLFQAAGYRDGEVGALLRMGEIHYSLANSKISLELFEQALTLCRAAGIKLYEPYILGNIGMVHESLGDRAQALRYYRRALALNRGSQDRRWQAHTQDNIAHVYEGLGDRGKALDHYHLALSLNRAAEDRFGESETLYNLARLKYDAGSLDEARTHIEEALRVAESLRADVASQTLRASYFASARQYYELWVDVLMQLHKARPGAGLDTVAFEASEKARARSMLETLKEVRAQGSGGTDSSLIERQRSLQQELNAKAERHMQLLADRQGAEAETLAKEIDRLTVEYDEVSSQIKTSNPYYASLTQPQPLSLSEIRQQALDDDSLLLEYFLGEKRSYLWAVTKTEISSYELPPRAEIENNAHCLYELLTTRLTAVGEDAEQRRLRVEEADRQYWPQARRLTQLILDPAAEHMTVKRLLIIPDGVLQYIPFQALTVPAACRRCGGQEDGASGNDEEPRPLVTAFEVINQSSASTLAALRDETSRRVRAPKELAVLADPVFEEDDPRIKDTDELRAAAPAAPSAELSRALDDVGLRGNGAGIPRLFGSQTEAEAIINTVPDGAVFKAVGFDASRSTVMNTGLGQYRIVHFATHGILDNKHPELSGIVLSLFDRDGKRQDGFLRLHDIYNLNLPVDLVVLSACNTGLGQDIKGEGLVGLTRGFIYAGSMSVVASLWKVDDRATSELMGHFYREMLSVGKSPAAALREAQLAVWKQKRWRSPYYWAAFTLQGEYGTKIAANPPVPNQMRLGYFATPGVFALILLLACFAAIKRSRNFNFNKRRT
jgi:CHAT domain-containing protein/tetratricopeptide (TPR) repeat protein